MPNISEARILIMASSGFEQNELLVPLQELRKRGATVHVAAPDRAPIRAWKERRWGVSITPDKVFSDIHPTEYNALVLPGAVINADSLRLNQKALNLIRHFVDAKKVIAAICHAPWLLGEINALRGREVTSYKSIRTGMINAGTKWQDQEIIVEGGFVASRSAADLPGFVGKIIEAIEGVRAPEFDSIGMLAEA